MVATLSTRKRHALELFEDLPAAYDWMGAVLSFGQDPRWRATWSRCFTRRTPRGI